MFGLTAFAQSSFASLGGNTYLKDLTESLSITDSFSGPITIPITVNESTVVDATVFTLHSIAEAVMESAVASDSYANTMLALASLNESTGVVDTYQQLTGKFVYVTETAIVNDAISAAGSVYNVSQDESENIQAFDSTGTIITANVTENSVTADSTQTAQLILNPNIQESTTIAEVYSAVGQLVAAINESSPVNAYQAGNIMAYVSISESSTPTDNQFGGNVVNVLLTENAGVATAQTASLIMVTSSIIESAGIADNMTYTVDTKGIVTGVLLTISLSSPLVWEQINDDQSPNWVEIKD